MDLQSASKNLKLYYYWNICGCIRDFQDLKIQDFIQVEERQFFMSIKSEIYEYLHLFILNLLNLIVYFYSFISGKTEKKKQTIFNLGLKSLFC